MSVPLFVLCVLHTGYTRQNETFRFQNLQKNTRSYAFRLIVFTSVKQSEIADIRLILTWAYRKEKIRGAETNLPDFRILPDKCQKNFPELFFTTSPPPSPKKFRSVYHFRGTNIFWTYQNFSKHHTNFPDITKFLTKLTEFVPFFFITSQYCPTVERILPDWLCLPNKLGGLAPPRPPSGTPMPPEKEKFTRQREIPLVFKPVFHGFSRNVT